MSSEDLRQPGKFNLKTWLRRKLYVYVCVEGLKERLVTNWISAASHTGPGLWIQFVLNESALGRRLRRSPRDDTSSVFYFLSLPL